MNILFLTLLDFSSLSERNLYCDLLREFVKNGHHVFAISPVESRAKESTRLIEEDGAQILKINIGRMQKTNVFEKGISMMTIESKWIGGIKKYFSEVVFDLVLYSTPPITLCGVVEYVKKRDGALTYLLLKDVFPQNAVDLQILGKKGIGGLLYNYFRKKEKRLYRISDLIGCMSPANVAYLLQNNDYLPEDKVHVCPNCVEPLCCRASEEEKAAFRAKYGIPTEKLVVVCGGNFGKPQGVDYLIDCLKACEDMDYYFVIAGSGTEYPLLKKYVKTCKPKHVKLLPELPREEFDSMAGCCDVGLVLLDHRFTIPNFPYRMLSYMQAGLPVLVASDCNTDMGTIAVSNQFGIWCESDTVDNFCKAVSNFTSAKQCQRMGDKGYEYLLQNYTSSVAYGIMDENIRKLQK